MYKITITFLLQRSILFVAKIVKIEVFGSVGATYNHLTGSTYGAYIIDNVNFSINRVLLKSKRQNKRCVYTVGTRVRRKDVLIAVIPPGS